MLHAPPFSGAKSALIIIVLVIVVVVVVVLAAQAAQAVPPINKEINISSLLLRLSAPVGASKIFPRWSRLDTHLMRSQDDRLLHDFVGRALVYHGGRQRRHLVGHARDQVLRDGLPRFADKQSHRYRRFFHIFCSPSIGGQRRRCAIIVTEFESVVNRCTGIRTTPILSPWRWKFKHLGDAG